MLALSKDFFLCGWNIFDLIIVSASLLDLIFELMEGLTVLRGLRLVSLLRTLGKIKFFKPLFFITCSTVTGTETSTIMDHDEGLAKYYHIHNRCFR